MAPAFRAVAPLLAGIAILVLGTGALNTIVPLRMDADGLPTWMTGVLMSCYFAGAIAGPFFCRNVIAAVGHIRTFAVFVSLASVAVLAHPFFDSVAAWAILRFAYGFCSVSIYVVVESWLNERATNDIRGRVLSVYVIVIFLFQGLGQFLVNLPDETGIALFVLISTLISLAAIPVLAANVDPPEVFESNRLSFGVLYRASPLGTLGMVGSGLIVGSILGLGPVYARGLGLDVANVSMFMSAGFIGGLVLQWPAGAISDRIGRRPVILILGLAVGGIALALATLPDGIAPIVPIALFGAFGAVFFVIYPMCIAITNDRLAPADLVPASSGLLILNNLGSATGPLAAGALSAAFGTGFVFVFCAAAGFGIALLAVWRSTRRPVAIPAEQDAFQMAPALTPVAAELDPRSDPDA